MNYGGESGGYSLADIAAATGNSGNNGGGMGFGNGEGAWLIILFLIFAAFGWGGNGNRGGFGGGNGGGGYGAADNYVLASDFATLQRLMSDGFNTTNRKADSIQEGICDATFALNNTITNGNFNIMNGLTQGFAGLNQNIVAQGYENRLGTQGLASELANCCCTIRQEISDCCCKTNSNIKDVSYNIAMGNNALQNAMCMNTRDIIDQMNKNYRDIHEELAYARLEAKNEKIAEQQNEINALRLAASQEKQNNFLVERLGEKCPVPSFIVPNPNCCYNYQVTQTNPCGCC